MTIGFICDKITEQPEGKIIILDGPSGCGKTSVLKALKGKYRKDVIIRSTEKLCNDVVACCRQEQPFETITKNISCDYFCIEDIDFMCGKGMMLGEISNMIKRLTSKDITVIITGIDIDGKMKGFLDTLNEYLYIKEKYEIYNR